ncbi:acyl-CoA thioesterase [Mariniblastus sp.]|nr:acyl-CoA thioesterase [Mariniblastus sp.]
MTFKTSRRVEFRDTDTAGIVHFSNFFAYMEQTEHEFLRSIGQPLFSEVDGKRCSWPRVATNCNYRSAILFEQMIDIELTIEKLGTTSITYAFQISREGTAVADGSITAVFCELEHGKKPKSIEIPAEFVAAVQPYLTE